MNVFFCQDIKQPTSQLIEQEAHHCVKVLRMKVGEQVLLFDGCGTTALAEIQELSKRKVTLSIIEKTKHSLPNRQVHIAIAPTKTNERIEWFLEKATEFNVQNITLFTSHHSERKKINQERFERILMTASKQSKRAFLPQLHALTSFQTLLKQETLPQDKFIATLHPTEDHFQKFKESQESILLIGPEGGFSQQEVDAAIEKGFKPVRLGQQRLRTETAGIYAASIIYSQQD